MNTVPLPGVSFRHDLPLITARNSASGEHTATRILSLDIVRGAVMILMALDHVRVYAGIPPGGPTAGLFLTRWVTHFCAPAFFFLAGIGAYLYGDRVPKRGQLGRWLLVRGLWLVLLELTVLRLAWTFNLDYQHYMLAGVIWSLGWCMAILAALVFLPLPAVAAFGITMIALHNAVFPLVARSSPSIRVGEGPALLKVLYFGGGIDLGGPGRFPLIILYSIVPWVGVMAAGYAFGVVMRMDPVRRARICWILGATGVALFAVLRGFDVYGDPRPWSSAAGPAPGWIRFLGATKYPASLSFLLMTLSPVFLLLPSLERARGRLCETIAVFGRVPLFFYLVHIPLIHLTAMLISLGRGDGGIAWLRGNHPVLIGPPPPGYMWNLAMLYVVWIGVVVLLYSPSRWFAALRAERPDSWLRYL
ncbi:MAG: DUF1624 domain-containing protein [Gemmatimonadaceae bacterium]